MSESKFVDGKSEPNKLVTGAKVFKQIWREMTLGVGFWGALRPLVAAILAAIPSYFWVTTSIVSIRKALI